MSTVSASDIDIQVLNPKKTIQASAVRPIVIPKYSIAITSGVDAVKEFILETLPARIGRGSEALIRLDGDLGVSRKHAEIYEQGGTLRIRDLQSTHGTQVNGLRIADRALESGDRIQVGSTILLLKRIKE